ncbi:MAG: DUF6968 family protein [Devosia sp.]
MIIATRTMHIRSDSGDISVAIRLFLPVPSGSGWDCPYEIDWPEGTVKSRAGGNDMIEAIHLALHKLGTEMYMSRYHHEGRLAWMPSWTGYNFPLPKNGRDLLIGDDQTFFGLDN